ncbi:LOW QUALITY PROTEIN: putative retroelement [Phytophthora palmivora]|uniref:Retroelement n=1 Tax=Phytophthora palmivora TaxID=4796 RepID=A0A2P4X4N6_9STRA|nr:LOW QUALITY PROTEIN: putative retroelement [Phytophthora palmivora]
MKYALVKFRVHLLGPRPFVIYTDHASLWTATNSLHLSQQMARWLSFFAEYNFHVEYKPGKLNVLADALSRRPDYELAHVSRVTTDLYDRIRLAYQRDENYTPLVQFLSDGKDDMVDRLSSRQRARLLRYGLVNGILHCRVAPADPPRVAIPNDEDLKYDILVYAHDSPMGGHLGRGKTYQAVSQTFWCPACISGWHTMSRHVKHREPSGHASTPLQSLPVPADCWKSMSLDFVFGLPADDKGNTGILVFVCRLSKMVHLAPVRDKVTGKQAAQLLLDSVFRYHGLPGTIVSDRDPRFTGAFWDTLFQLLGTKLTMSTADHPQTDGQTERVNRALEDTLRSICAEAPRSWSDQLPMVEFALNNAVHTSTGFTPFYLNGLRHPQVPLTLRGGTDASIFRAQEDRCDLAISQNDFATETQWLLLDTKNLPLNLVSFVGSNKLKHRFIGPFAVLARHSAAYTVDLLKSMATHPTFYVGRLKRYHDPLGPPSRTEEDQDENSPPRNEAESSGQPALPVSKPVNDTQAGTYANHTTGMTVPNGKSLGKSYTHKPSGTNTPAAHKRASDHAPHGLESLSLDGGGSQNSAVNTPVELSSLTTQSVHILTKDLKGP